MDDDALWRYHRQMLLPGIGEAGQKRLRESRVLLVGCGALGCVIADALARAGVGWLRVVDRDVVELTNLQRQILFDEEDAARATPKAEAARRRLQAINSEVTVEAVVDDCNAMNVMGFAEGVDVVMDGLDNFETRYLLNDVAVKLGLPLLYGGAVATTGMSMVILPLLREGNTAGRVRWGEAEATPCLRCLFPESPPAGTTMTCDTAGVLGPVVSMVGARQAAEAIKLLSGNVAATDRRLHSFDAWTNTMHAFDVSGARVADCPCCGQRRFDHLEGSAGAGVTSLCGRNAVQVLPGGRHAAAGGGLDLAVMAARLRPHGAFEAGSFMLRGVFEHERGEGGEAIELTLFPNGRAIVKGTSEPERARGIVAKYVG